MTYEETLKHAKSELEAFRLKVAKGYDHYKIIVAFYENVVKALEKQIPKKPKYKEFGASKYWDCPICGEVVLSHIDGIPLKNEYNHDHCGGCGQAIDWSEE